MQRIRSPLTLPLLLILLSLLWLLMLPPLANAASLKLAWIDMSNNEDKFQVERSVNGAALSFVLLVEPAANAVLYVDTTALVNVEYAYRVRAVNAAGPSGYSNIALGKLLPSPPPPPPVPATPGGLTVVPLP